MASNNDFDFSILTNRTEPNYINHYRSPNNSNNHNLNIARNINNDSSDDDLQKALQQSKEDYEVEQISQLIKNDEVDLELQKIIRESLLANQQENENEMLQKALKESEKEFKLEQDRLLKKQQDYEYEQSLIRDSKLKSASNLAIPVIQPIPSTQPTKPLETSVTNAQKTPDLRSIRDARLKYFQNKS